MKNKYDIFKPEGERNRWRDALSHIRPYEYFLSLMLKKEDTPMHNFEDPFHYSPVAFAGDEVASISCIAAGSN